MKTIFALIVALGITTPAWSVPITVGTVQYDISIDYGTFDEVNLRRGLTLMDWFGRTGLASRFAAASGVFSDVNSGYGPLYAVRLGGPFAEGIAMRVVDGVVTSRSAILYERVNWAYVQNSNVPEPGSITLIMLGLAGLSLSRKARR